MTTLSNGQTRLQGGVRPDGTPWTTSNGSSEASTTGQWVPIPQFLVKPGGPTKVLMDGPMVRRGR